MTSGPLSFLLLVNKQGQTRLAQYYESITRAERNSMEGELIRLCISKSPKECSFIQFKEYRVIFKKYASLYFIVGAKDESLNELAVLDFIHCLVETLDKYFENVCELDILYNLEKAYYILDEMVVNGFMTDSNRVSILGPLYLMDRAGSSV